MMTRFAAAVGLAAVLLAAPASAMDKVTLQLRWATQAEFAGYYVAKDKGYYRDAGLDVTINPGGPHVSPPQVIARGGADIIIDWMASALIAREKGEAIVNVAQPFKRSGLQLTCRADTGITSPADLRGRTMGVWFSGSEYPFLAWMARLGYKIDGSPGGVKVLKQGFGVDPLLQKQADCISTMMYNEYWQIIDAGLTPSELVVFKYDEQGVTMLEDGLYVMESQLKDPAFVKRIASFVKASMRGWEYSRQNPDGATNIVLANDTNGAQNEKHQRRMMDEIDKLLDSNNGKLDPHDYARTVVTLLAGGSAPIITRRPIGAWSHAIYDAMK
jgi:NitT/TauT family transport system substrate-binding protein